MSVLICQNLSFIAQVNPQLYIYIAMEAIGHTLYQFNSVVTHLGNHELEVYGLQTFWVFSQHSKWVITLVNVLSIA